MVALSVCPGLHWGGGHRVGLVDILGDNGTLSNQETSRQIKGGVDNKEAQ